MMTWPRLKPVTLDFLQMQTAEGKRQNCTNSVIPFERLYCDTQTCVSPFMGTDPNGIFSTQWGSG